MIVDKASGELVENRTYRPYGDEEQDYRTARWQNLREDYGFTGKESDVEVGLIYFGKRFLVPSLGRWLNPDPLALHAPGKADLNLYAYVRGRVFASIDPLGLADESRKDSQQTSSSELKNQRSSAEDRAADATVADNQSSAEALTNGKASVPASSVSVQSSVAQVKTTLEQHPQSAEGAKRREAERNDALYKKDRADDAAMPTGLSSYIPVYGPFRDAQIRWEQGRYTYAFANMALGILDVSLVESLAKTAVRGSAGLLLRMTAEVGVESVADASSSVQKTGTAMVKYDGEFAARQLLGQEPVTPGGRTIMSHAAERMVQPPKGRAPMTMAEVDQVLDTADKIRKVSPHPDGATITLQSTTMPGKPQVVVDAATGRRVITVVKQR
ncbi:MAG: RHS repeat-associated core domain-containing protein [Polyangiaceae bacterium]|nr:RHS repeat-associated core domain-containing protein [Polyangiaceae bacterium]